METVTIKGKKVYIYQKTRLKYGYYIAEVSYFDNVLPPARKKAIVYKQPHGKMELLSKPYSQKGYVGFEDFYEDVIPYGKDFIVKEKVANNEDSIDEIGYKYHHIRIEGKTPPQTPKENLKIINENIGTNIKKSGNHCLITTTKDGEMLYNIQTGKKMGPYTYIDYKKYDDAFMVEEKILIGGGVFQETLWYYIDDNGNIISDVISARTGKTIIKRGFDKQEFLERLEAEASFLQTKIKELSPRQKKIFTCKYKDIVDAMYYNPKTSLNARRLQIKSYLLGVLKNKVIVDGIMERYNFNERECDIGKKAKQKQKKH